MQEETIAVAVIWAIYNRNDNGNRSKLDFKDTNYNLSISQMSDSRIDFYLNNQQVVVNISGDNFDFNGAGVSSGSGKVSGKEVSELTAGSFKVYYSDIRFSNNDDFTVKSQRVRVY